MPMVENSENIYVFKNDFKNETILKLLDYQYNIKETGQSTVFE